MPLVTDPALCLRRTDYSETSQILTLFTRQHGLLRVIAKGARRVTKAGKGKFDGGIDLLDTGQATFTLAPDKDLATLTEWQLAEGHRDLRADWRSLTLALYAAELVPLVFEEHDPQPDVFTHLYKLLRRLRHEGREAAMLLFLVDLLRRAGLLPELHACVVTGQRITAGTVGGFSPGRGGMLSQEGTHGVGDVFRLEPDTWQRLVWLASAVQRDDVPARAPRIDRQQATPVHALLVRYLEHALGRRLRVPKYL